MNPEQQDQRLSRISTVWPDVFAAHGDQAETVGAARQRLLLRYQRPAIRYLLGAVHDAEAADEIFQEFALRLVRGDFKRAAPERGRFRHFLKTALYHLIIDYQRQKRRSSHPLSVDVAAPTEQHPEAAEEQFLALWRAELLQRTWETLDQFEQHSGQPLATVLRFRMDHPEWHSTEMAGHLAVQLNKPLTANGFRKLLYQARQKFTELLVEEVAHSLADPTHEAIQEELLDLGLLTYCRPALERCHQH